MFVYGRHLLIGGIASMVLAFGLTACTPTTAPPNPTAANPDLRERCGIDINLVIDRSNSVAQSISTATNAAQALVDGLSGTGSRVRLASFGGFASAHPNGQNEASYALGSLQWSNADGYTVPPLTNVQGPYGDVFPERGSTNMEGGLEVIRRAPGPIGELTILFSDGEPNEHFLASPDGFPGPNVNLGRALSEAVSEANTLKAMGSHILAVGVTGWGGITRDTLQAVSGPDRVGDVPIQQADYVDLSSFDQAVPALTQIAHELCRSSLGITKLGRWQGELRPICDWPFALSADPEPLSWSGGGTKDTKQVTTCKATNQNDPRPYGGFTSIAWEPSASPTVLTISERTTRGYTFASATCTKADRINGGRIPVPVTIVSPGIFTVQVGPDDEMRCEVINDITPLYTDSGAFLLKTKVADPTDGETLITAKFNGTSTVAVPGYLFKSSSVGFYALLLTSQPGWYLDSLVCDGVTKPSPLQAQIQIADQHTTVCEVTVSRTPTAGYVTVTSLIDNLEPFASIAPQPTTWSLTFPSGNESQQTAGAIIAGTGGSATHSWGVDPGTPYTLAPQPIYNNLRLDRLSCKINGNSAQDMPLTGMAFEVLVGRITSCTAHYFYLRPAGLTLTATVEGDNVPTPIGDLLKWELQHPALATYQQVGSYEQGLSWTTQSGTFDLVESPQIDHLTFLGIDCLEMGVTPKSSSSPSISLTLLPDDPNNANDLTTCVAHYTYHADYVSPN